MSKKNKSGLKNSAQKQTADDTCSENDPQKDKKKKKEVKFSKIATSWAIWIAAILFLKFYVADIFVIPSGSMEPTLHGRVTGGDRIFCTRIDYWFRNPHRWEVFVFKFPYEQDPGSPYKGENFIKRCVGLPGESLVLNRGDVYRIDPATGKAEVLRKTPEIQHYIWIPVYRQDLSKVTLDELHDYWDVSGGKLENGILKGEAKLSFIPHTRFSKLGGVPDRYVRQQVVEFKCPTENCEGKLLKTVNIPQMTGHCPKCGRYLTEKNVIRYTDKCEYPASQSILMDRAGVLETGGYRNSNWHNVADLRLSVQARLQTDQTLSMQLFDDIFLCRAEFIMGDDGKLNVSCSIDGKKDTKASSTSFSVAVNKWLDISFFRLDGLLYATVNGKTKKIGELPLDLQMPDNLRTSGADLNIGQGGEIRYITLDRDIHYYDTIPGRILKMEPKKYLALGDNCPSSNDSRGWGTVPQRNLVGVARYVWWPLNQMKPIQ